MICNMANSHEKKLRNELDSVTHITSFNPVRQYCDWINKSQIQIIYFHMYNFVFVTFNQSRLNFLSFYIQNARGVKLYNFPIYCWVRL